MVILDSNCLWVRSLRDYLLYSGDEGFVRTMLPAARRLMDLLHGFVNPQQVLDSPPFAYWLDHAVIDRRGANLCLNGHYLGAVDDFAQVLRWLNEPGAEEFENRANAIRVALRENFWVPDRKLFADALVDGTPSSMFSEQSNALALLQQVASRQQAAEIAQQLLVNDQHDFVQRESGMTMVTPAVSYALHAGLARYGYVEQSLSKFRQRFDRMLTPTSNGTLWEEWWLDGTGRSGKFRKGKTRSDAQTESAFPPALFGEFLLGVRPTEPGLKQVQLSRPRSGLSRLEGTVPSPLGPLYVRWAISDSGGGQLHLTIPEAMQVQVDTSTLDMKRGSSLIVGDREISSTEIPPRLHLSNGSHKIQF
jgi:hypothetical protein